MLPSGAGGGVTSVTSGGVPIIVSPTTGAVIVSFENWYEGTGAPTIVAPVDSIYRDTNNPTTGLWVNYSSTPGSPGLFIYQKADGATSVYRLNEGTGTVAVDSVGGLNATYTGSSSFVAALTGDQTYAVSFTAGSVTFPFQDPPGILSSGAYTIEVVVHYTAAGGATYEQLFANNNTSGYNGLNEAFNNATLQASYGGSVPAGQVVPSGGATHIFFFMYGYNTTEPSVGGNSAIAVDTGAINIGTAGAGNMYRAANNAITFALANSPYGSANYVGVAQSIAFYPHKLNLTQRTNHYNAIANTGSSDWRNVVVTGSAASNVVSLNGLQGAVDIVAGANITVTPSGSNITIAASGSGGGTNYNATILAEATLTHFWPLNDASGSTSAADAVSSGAVALPQNGTVNFGAPAITADLQTCLLLPGNTSDYLGFPNTPLIPASGDYTLEFILNTPLWYPDVSTQNGLMVPICIDGGTGLIFFISKSYAGAVGAPLDGIVLDVNGTASGTGAGGYGPTIALGRTFHIALVVSSGGVTTTMFVNALPSQVIAAVGRQASGGKVGTYGAATHYPYLGYMAKLAIYSSALTQASLLTHVANMTLY